LEILGKDFPNFIPFSDLLELPIGLKKISDFKEETQVQTDTPA